MKIAQVSPLIESVPPKTYGGIERVVSYLTEELVRQGHDVTLFASGDSLTQAKLISASPTSVRSSGRIDSWLTYQTIQLEQLRERAANYDIIHFHTGYAHFPLARLLSVPHLTTMHDRQDLPELAPLYKQFPDLPLISISNSQRAPQPGANWIDTVYHGLPDASYSFCSDPENYFVFMGRISPDKRVDRAIEIAIRCHTPIYIGAKIDKSYEEYFHQHIQHLFEHPLVHYLGEVGGDDKRCLLQKAKALLFPIDWPEPFGLVMIEAMACGTPVIAYRNGAVPEVMEDDVTGFVVSNQEEAVSAAGRLHRLDRHACRAVFERRFTAKRMTENYLRVYRKLIWQQASHYPRQALGNHHG